LSPRLVLEIEIAERLSGIVADDEAGVVRLIDRPGRGETAERQKAKANAATKRMPHPIVNVLGLPRLSFFEKLLSVPELLAAGDGAARDRRTTSLILGHSRPRPVWKLSCGIKVPQANLASMVT